MDMIDKRDQQEKMVRSIIKRRNVIYSPGVQGGMQAGMQPGMQAGAQGGMQQPMQAGVQQGTPSSHENGGSENAAAMEVLARLEREAAEDEAAKQAEIQRAIAQQEEKDLAISRILNEKENERQRAMAQVRGE